MELNPADLQNLLVSLKHTPVHALGQNFLLDLTVVDQVVAAALADKSTPTILEIGPGLGILTEELLIKASEHPLKPPIIAVERDHDLANRLIKLWGKGEALTVVKEDIVHFDRAEWLKDGEYVLAANLPFGVTNFVLNAFLTRPPRPTKLVVMVQKEVADRLLAPAGHSARGLLSVVCEYYATGRRVVAVPRTAFWPVPKVDATVIELVIKRPVGDQDEAFFGFVKRLFAHRRKQLGKTLTISNPLSKEAAVALLTSLQIDPTVRAQDLTLDQWQALWAAMRPAR